MSIAFVFPGQGSQRVGMGKSLFDAFPESRAVFDAVDDALGEKLSTLCFEGPEEKLKLTANTQPATLAVSMAAHAAFAKRGPRASFLAGHSLGEYSALVAAGAMGLQDAVRAVRARGQLMQEAVPAGLGAMAAVLGLPPEKVREICQAEAKGQVVSPANYNSPEQTVIAGHADAVERTGAALTAAGAVRVIPLPVSAPFHCALMEPVKAGLAGVLTRISVGPLSIPVVTNVEAKPNSDPARVVPLLLEQVTHPVRWVESVEELARQGVKQAVELGPGKVLSGLIRRTTKAFACGSVEDAAGLGKLLASLGGG